MKKNLALAMLTVVLLCGCAGGQKSYFGKIPYNVKFGSTYDQVASLDKGAETPQENNSGTQMVSPHRKLDGTFLGYNKDDLDISLMYALGTDDSLNSVGEYITVQDGADITVDDLYNDLLDYFTEKYGENENDLWIVKRGVWHTDDDVDIDMTVFNETMMAISFTAN